MPLKGNFTMVLSILLAAAHLIHVSEGTVCPGSIKIGGIGGVDAKSQKLVPVMNGGKIVNNNQGLTVSPWTRVHFGVEGGCRKWGQVQKKDLLAFDLLNHKIKYSIDLSMVDCDCNIALYLVSISDNDDPLSKDSECKADPFYCDASNVCGRSCTEIDIMEANKVAFLSTVHNEQDPNGQGNGLGGGETDWSGPRVWWEKYGPGEDHCINTEKPFTVEASFPTDSSGKLKHNIGMQVKLSQTNSQGVVCHIDMNAGSGYPALTSELSNALSHGMNLVYSYWGGDGVDMDWLDGPGSDKKGGCPAHVPDLEKYASCKGSPRIFDISIESLSLSPSAPAPAPAPAPVPPHNPLPIPFSTLQPTEQPVSPPSLQPTQQPVSSPSLQPTQQPVSSPSLQPTEEPVSSPSLQPTQQPVSSPSLQRTEQPVSSPSLQRTEQPVSSPSLQPTEQPVSSPSLQRTEQPVSSPSLQPTQQQFPTTLQIVPNATSQKSGTGESDTLEHPTTSPVVGTLLNLYEDDVALKADSSPTNLPIDTPHWQELDPEITIPDDSSSTSQKFKWFDAVIIIVLAMVCFKLVRFSITLFRLKQIDSQSADPSYDRVPMMEADDVL